MRRRVFTTIAAVLLAGLPLVASPRPAAADAIADKRAEAQRVSRQLDAMADKVATLVEDYNEARVRAARVDRRMTAAATELQATDARMTKVRSRVRDQAVASYVHGGNAPAIVIVAQAKPTDDLGVRQAYIRTVAMRTADSLDELRATRMSLEEQQHALAASRDQAKAALAAVDSRRRQATAAANAQRQLVAKVQGELSSLVAAESRRKAQEAARRMQADLAARKARQAARASRGTSGGLGADDAAASLAGPPASGAAAAVAMARRQLGKPYHYGSAGPDSFDCSGLTSFAWRAGGKTLPHSSRAQWSATSRVSIDALQPGDIVFYGRPIHHVGLYVGGGEMIEASETGTPVRQTTIYRGDLVGAGRVN
jgi:cell wall-associated NlpC family hydrolase